LKNWSPKTILLFQFYFFGWSAGAGAAGVVAGTAGLVAGAAGLVAGATGAGAGGGVDFLQPLNATIPMSNILTRMIILPILPFIFGFSLINKLMIYIVIEIFGLLTYNTTHCQDKNVLN
jgi:hypothetical protein